MRPEYGDVFRFDRVLNVHFYTSSAEKLLQARLVFARCGYGLRHFRGDHEPYEENYTLGTRELLENALRQINVVFGLRSVFFVEDTSVRIEALSGTEDFPGLRVKEWFARTSFGELDHALRARGHNRRATVKSDIALFVPTLSRPLFFHGEVSGVVAATPPAFAASVQYPWLTPDTFNGWFIPDGARKRLGEMEFEESLEHDFRVQSLQSLIQRIEELNAALNIGPTLYNVQGQAPRPRAEQLSFLEKDHPDVLLIIGRKCAGKTTFSDRIAGADQGRTIEASSVLRQTAAEHGIEIARPEDALRFLEERGMHMVAARAAEIIERAGVGLNVVTGARTIEEILYLTRAFPQARVVLVEADLKTRFERHLRRARDSDVRTLAEFAGQDESQAKFGVLRVEQEIAEIVLRNEGPIEQFHGRIGQLLRALKADGLQPVPRPAQLTELHRCLRALNDIGMAATCDEISEATDRVGPRVRRYNTNRALKGVPEFAVRVKHGSSLLRYQLTDRGRALLALLDARIVRM